MGQKTEWLEEEWERPQKRNDGGYRRKGKRTTRTYRKWSTTNSKMAYFFGLGFLMAALLNFVARSLH